MKNSINFLLPPKKIQSYLGPGSERRLFEPENCEEGESKSDVVNGPSLEEKTKTWLFLFLLLLIQATTGSCHLCISENPISTLRHISECEKPMQCKK